MDEGLLLQGWIRRLRMGLGGEDRLRIVCSGKESIIRIVTWTSSRCYGLLFMLTNTCMFVLVDHQIVI